MVEHSKVVIYSTMPGLVYGWTLQGRYLLHNAWLSVWLNTPRSLSTPQCLAMVEHSKVVIYSTMPGLVYGWTLQGRYLLHNAWTQSMVEHSKVVIYSTMPGLVYGWTLQGRYLLHNAGLSVWLNTPRSLSTPQCLA